MTTLDLGPAPILAIDPGTTESAHVLLLCERGLLDVAAHGKGANGNLLRILEHARTGPAPAVVIERIEPRYGSQMGMETIVTAEWVGRFVEAARPLPVHLLRRSAILRHLGVAARGASADAGVRAALIDRFGGRDAAIGRKATPGPLHGIVADQWQALAVAVTFFDVPELAEAVPS